MKRRNILFIFILCAALALSLTIMLKANPWHATNTNIIKSNWNIDLSSADADIYYKDTGPSFHGDGPRVSIMKYNDFEPVRKAVGWKDGPNKDIEFKVNEILTSGLRVDSKYMPDFKTQYKYYSYKKDSLNSIYLIYIERENYLYAIEDLY